MDEKEVLIFDGWKAGFCYTHDDGKFKPLVSGFTGSPIELPKGYTHFGVVLGGEMKLDYTSRRRVLVAGDFFSVIGPARVSSAHVGGLGIVISARGYKGLNVFGGPLENEGRLRYIDGCTDTLLVPPVRKGDACLNYLHFPKGICQTPHTHPSVRIGVVCKGSGECFLPESGRALPLARGNVFVIKTGAAHSFNTDNHAMGVIAFHPDSDTGMTDEDHPMINRTIVDGVNAKSMPEIRTK